ncbi:hypothetical protein ACU635_60785 [[Actinomadura] parvosata]|uniref:hypothetical protein n=1 Tax=[Actinomadura] parvosata TaxID=1955412 RepID=UPI00406C2E5F
MREHRHAGRLDTWPGCWPPGSTSVVGVRVPLLETAKPRMIEITKGDLKAIAN